jgi:hypothetical protein
VTIVVEEPPRSVVAVIGHPLAASGQFQMPTDNGSGCGSICAVLTRPPLRTANLSSVCKNSSLEWTRGRLRVHHDGEGDCDSYYPGDNGWIAVANLGDVYLGIAVVGIPPRGLEVIDL